METDGLYQTLKRQPFQPVRLYMSDGSHYDILHPDQVIMDRRWSHVGIGRNGDGPFQRIAIIYNLHIVRIEPLSRKRNRSKSK